VEQEAVHLVGEDELLDVHAALSQLLDELDGLGEGDVPVVVPVDQEHGRAPRVERRHRGGLEGEPAELGPRFGLVGRHEVPDARVPVVHAVHVHARPEQVGGTRESHGGQIPAVRSAPQTDAVPVDVLAVGEMEAGAHDVPELRATRGAVVERLPELEPVADAAPVVHREDDRAPVRHVLVERIGVVVIAAVVEPEVHLSPRAAVQEEERRLGRRAAACGRRKELRVDLEPIRGPEYDLLGFDEMVGREAVGNAAGREPVRLAFTQDRRMQRRTRAGRQVGDRTVGERDRGELEACSVSVREGARSPALHRDTPQVLAVDVALVGGVDELAAVGARRDVLNLAPARGELRGGSAVGRHRVQVHPPDDRRGAKE
jgi:hypothetical protein